MLGISLLAITIMAAQPPAAQGPCSGPAYQLLDFWVGQWDVFASDAMRVPRGTDRAKRIGTNVIEKTLGGRAIFEHWSDAGGGAGKSLFYYDPAASTWKQVWVGGYGSVKEKPVVDAGSPTAVRFQGELRVDGKRILDRTTLTPLSDGSVRQHIEESADDGRNWTTTFDAIYRKSADVEPTLDEAWLTAQFLPTNLLWT